MPVADFAQGVKTPFFAMAHHAGDAWPSGQSAATAANASAASSKTASADSGKSFWDNVLDVINPLEHLPVIGTIYRNITGDKPGDLEKVAGDTLYGGPVGLASSLADVAFEKITGKDFGDTVLGLFEGGDKPAALASTAKPMNALPARATMAADAPPAAMIPAALAKPIVAKPVDGKQTAAVSPAANDQNTQALLASMTQSGVDSDLGMRALFAYQKSMGLSPAPPNGLAAAP